MLVLGDVKRVAGRLWVRVRLPGLPDDVGGWVPRSVLGGYTPVRTRLVVDRTRLTATLLRGRRPLVRTRVGVGTLGVVSAITLRCVPRFTLHRHDAPRPLDRAALDLFPAWLPGAEWIEGPGGLGVAAVRSLFECVAHRQQRTF